VNVLWIPHTSWATPQRAHTFCRELVKHHTVHVTDWVADFRSPGDYLSRQYLRNFLYRRSQDAAIVVHGIPRISPALFVPALRRLNAAVFARYLRRIIAAERIDVVVGTFVAPPPEAPRLVFDVFDDNVGYWQTYGPVKGYAADIATTEAAYLRRADAVVAVSSVLADHLVEAGYDGPLAIIPNGVRLGDFDQEPSPTLRQELGLRGRVIGLIGNHNRLYELEKVLDVAERLSGADLTFLIVGRGAAVEPARKLAQQKRLSNVRFVGFVPPARVTAYFALVDVGLCPYKQTASAHASCPMRLMSYLAAGSSVVCTDLEEVRRMRFPNVVLVGDSPEEMTRGIVEVLGRPRQRPAILREYDVDTLVDRYERVLLGEMDGLAGERPVGLWSPRA
jgi:hypothetical protein